jgi:hypothetical protein
MVKTIFNMPAVVALAECELPDTKLMLYQIYAAINEGRTSEGTTVTTVTTVTRLLHDCYDCYTTVTTVTTVTRLLRLLHDCYTTVTTVTPTRT